MEKSINPTHLHVHSHFSLLNALPQIPDIIKEAKKNNLTSLAITDDGNLYGAIEFYKECKKEGIKPVIGVDFYFALDGRLNKRHGIDNKRARVILLAKSNEGYTNLTKLVTKSFIDGFYYKPRIDLELLKEHKEGLICILPSLRGPVSHYLRQKDSAKALWILKEFEQIFTKDNLYLQITKHPEIDGYSDITNRIVTLSKENNIGLVAGHEIHYLFPEDKIVFDVVRAIQLQNIRGEKNRSFKNENEDFSFITPEEMTKRFSDHPDALKNIEKIVAECDISFELGSWVFPSVVIPEGTTYESEFRKLVYGGIERRKIEKTKEVEERLEYELSVIKHKGFFPYFLAVADLLDFAHKNGILSAIRGSVAGSLATYLSGITNINPLEYKLPFERFLNIERPLPPDIDMDFADNRRNEMIAYAKRKYGEDHVAQIGTFGSMMARGAVRDVARALGYPYTLGDQIAKLIPMGSQGFPMTIDRALDMEIDLRRLYDTNSDVKKIINIAKKIEGNARHISIHAAGVVIAPFEISDRIPLQKDTKNENVLITQFDMHAVEDIGLLKFDFLGLKNLAILADTIQRVKNDTGITINTETIPLNDKKTFEILAHGETLGLFQLNGAVMTKYLKELKPSSIFDINAMVALYRPGPMESIPEYIERKHNPEKVKYLDPRMKEILDRSYGVITYQDDVMMIAIKLAGYSWLEADKLRKAMGKKIPEVMQAEKSKLVEGLLKNGMSAEKAETLWKLIEPFAAYGFNKAHAASYGRVAYQTAYMKANFPEEYMAAILTADAGDVEKIAEMVNECKRMKIDVLTPDVNESEGQFSVVTVDGKKCIRFGLFSIKNFGEGIANVIFEERKANGKFKDLADFLTRIKDKNLNKKSLEALIKSGALDSFQDRGTLLSNIEYLLAWAKESRAIPEPTQTLFGGLEINQIHNLNFPNTNQFRKSQFLAWEKELLGLYLSGHPLEPFKEKIKQKLTIKQLKNSLSQGFETGILGVVESIDKIITKNESHMVFLRISDLSDQIEVVVFSRVYEKYKDICEVGKIIVVNGKISRRNDELSMVADTMKDIS